MTSEFELPTDTELLFNWSDTLFKQVGILAAGDLYKSEIPDTCELFDGVEQNWNFVVSLQTSRCSASAATKDDQANVFGGQDKNGRDLDSVEQYNCATNT